MHFRPDLARWRQLPSPAWLARLLDGAPVQAAPAGAWRLFEVGCDSGAAYLAGHIPGAAYIDTNRLERQPLWNKVSDEALLALLLENGIGHDTTVILYGRNSLAAARAAHLMLYAGVADVRLLDGGLDGWLRAGHALQQGAPAPVPPAAAFGAAFPARPDFLIDTAQARELLQQADGALVSIRTWQEHVGATSGYSYIEARGDIPGARWGRAGNDGDVHSMSEYQHADGTMKPPAEISALWRQAGVGPGQRTAFYCGTGWRASLAFFYAWLMAWERISVYDGGWCEWSRVNPPASCSGSRP
ncbi:sulfurtransferase [Pseudoduganella sp. DS3]|uniref:Sulfurtransferase n=1 Tax=Pseudoduganella guangdongensis TaxID=2692179 RepID=A0A6N9HID3_9BURK|nr:rhodanese-like domain-containing protein [Pseudoduganella guangdongensis]MYN03037.1 sulfurtransferase [Pseudoduganella guangdongensis]